MKRSILILLLALSAAACTQPGKAGLRSGDLIFVGIPTDDTAASDGMDQAIAAATGNGELNLIHVAIADIEADSVYVIDATLRHGVDRHPLDTFLRDFTRKDGSLPIFLVKRLKDPDAAPDCIQRARTFVGQPYDNAFLPGNGALYCSELVRESYRRSDGTYLFENQPMNWKDSDGNIPQYWIRLFGKLGMDVPQGEPGTNPQDMAASELLVTVPVQIP